MLTGEPQQVMLEVIQCQALFIKEGVTTNRKDRVEDELPSEARKSLN